MRYKNTTYGFRRKTPILKIRTEPMNSILINIKLDSNKKQLQNREKPSRSFTPDEISSKNS